MSRVQVHYKDFQESKKYLIFLASMFEDVIHMKYENENVYRTTDVLIYFKNGNIPVMGLFTLLKIYTFYEDDNIKIQCYNKIEINYETEHKMNRVASLQDATK